MGILALYNPVCGSSSAHDFFTAHVLPLLASHDVKVVATESEGHAGVVVTDFLLDPDNSEDDRTVILGSGDGTLHEIINHLSANVPASARRRRLHFALVPCGTANALYSSLFPPGPDADSVAYKLQSVQSLLDRKPAIPLTIAITRLFGPPASRSPPAFTVSAVVTSTALHAAILRDSESLRATHPGIERFKIAAAQNLTKWYYAWAKLLPAPDAGVVQIYDADTKGWITHPDSHEDDPIVDVDGPFTYWLSTVNVDRLEPQFKITPHGARSQATLDLVLVRPFRDPTVSMDTPDARTAFSAKVMKLLHGAYDDGAHLDLRYGPDGELVTGGDGEAAVEYVRCGGWEWAPDDSDEDAHVLCADGAIFPIAKGGRALCNAAKPDDSAGFMVYA
ncbi:hypothetical protein PLICRDRAFT_699110 [Plicaturopsis crispa FD-325 SS-3]|nr:hypothetical protein PLICRDRAFT_699110 [Plicaturopsis crispa FD-325 SS-3]